MKISIMPTTEAIIKEVKTRIGRIIIATIIITASSTTIESQRRNGISHSMLKELITLSPGICKSLLKTAMMPQMIAVSLYSQG